MRKITILVKGGQLDAMAAATIYLPRGVKLIPKETAFNSTTVNVFVPEGKAGDVSRVLAHWYAKTRYDDEVIPGYGFPDWTLLHYSDATGDVTSAGEKIDAR